MDFDSRVTRGLDGNYNRNEKRFQEELKLRSVRYGFFRPGQPVESPKCSKCSRELHGHHVVINKIPFCSECYCETNKQPS